MILYAILFITLIEIVWTCFGFYMAVRDAWKLKRLTRTAIALSLLPLLVGIATDVLLNVIASAAFLDWMPTWTLSQRVQALVDTGTGWRKKLALWISVNLLDSFSGKGTPHIDIPVPLPPLPAQ